MMIFRSMGLSYLTMIAMIVIGLSFSLVARADTLNTLEDPVPGFSLAALELDVRKNSCEDNQAQTFLRLKNTGSDHIKLSDVSFKYWVHDTSGQTVVPQIFYGGCLEGSSGCYHQVSGVSSQAGTLAPACGAYNERANWEITVSTTDEVELAPGEVWNNLQAQVHLQDYSNFVPGRDTWYSACDQGGDFESDPHYAVYYKNQLVYTSGVTAPECRSPKGSQPLDGHLTDAIRQTPVVGDVPQETLVYLAVGLPHRDPIALRNFVEQVSNPHSPLYRQYLSRAQLTAEYGPTAADYAALQQWASESGLTIRDTFESQTLLGVVGTVATVERALHVNLQRRLRPDGTEFFALDREPSIDLGATVLHVEGLENFSPPVPLLSLGEGAHQGNDFRSAYARFSEWDGTGQCVALFGGNTGFDLQDLADYKALTGLTTTGTITLEEVGGFNSVVTGDLHSLETAMNLQVLSAMAPGLDIIVIVGPNGAITPILQAMAESGCNQLSASWLFRYTPLARSIVDEFVAQGQSFFQGSGNDGGLLNPTVSDRSYVNAPDSVTRVGGTTLSLNAGSYYLGEAGWIWSTGFIDPLTAIPEFQFDIDMSLSGGSTTQRNVPDIAMVGDDVTVVATLQDFDIDPATGEVRGLIAGTTPVQGQVVSLGGTSVATPLWAAFTALANQFGAAHGRNPIGAINPIVYDIGKNPELYAATFNDVTTGTNGVYSAVAGYDLVTGWGSPKRSMIEVLASYASCELGTGMACGSACCSGSDICIDESRHACAQGSETRSLVLDGSLTYTVGGQTYATDIAQVINLSPGHSSYDFSVSTNAPGSGYISARFELQANGTTVEVVGQSFRFLGTPITYGGPTVLAGDTVSIENSAAGNGQSMQWSYTITNQAF